MKDFALKWTGPDRTGTIDTQPIPPVGEKSAVTPDVSNCGRGWHAHPTDHLEEWVDTDCYVVQLLGSRDDKPFLLCAGQICTVRRLAWGQADMDAYARWCVNSAQEYALSVQSSGNAEEGYLVSPVESRIRKLDGSFFLARTHDALKEGLIRLAAKNVQNVAGCLAAATGKDTTTARKDESARQSRWLLDRLRANDPSGLPEI